MPFVSFLNSRLMRCCLGWVGDDGANQSKKYGLSQPYLVRLAYNILALAFEPSDPDMYRHIAEAGHTKELLPDCRNKGLQFGRGPKKGMEET